MVYHWGEYIKNLRIENGWSLRAFCKEVHIDPSRWSKIERGIAHLPTDKSFLEDVEFHLVHGPEERTKFWLLYSIYEVGETKSVIDKLPLLLSGKKEKDFQKLYELIKNS